MSQLKVFEFAKEIGIETLTLMDKIREWKLPVRSHMAELDPELMSQIKERLEAESAPKADDGKKKKAVKKAAAPKAPAAKKAAAAAPKATTAKKATARKAEGEVAEKKTTSVRKAAAKTVIRRKADEEEAALEAAEETVEAIVEAEETFVASPEPAAALQEPTPAAAVEEPAEEEQIAVPIEAPVAPTPVAVAPPAPVEQDKSVPTPGRKREVMMTSSGPVSGVKSDAPKRNIVGRMDLSRVAPPPSSSSSGGYTGGGRPGGPRPPSNQQQRTLRTGFVAPPPMMAPEGDEELERRKEGEKQKRRLSALGAATATTTISAREKERELELASFSSTEFRKREMVFQPKKKKGSLAREARRTQITVPKASKRIVKINGTIKLGELAQEMGLKAAQLVKALMAQGVVATMTTELDFDTVALIVPEFGFEAVNVQKTVAEMVQASAFGELGAESIVRSPVVTVMGHVDHGKTSLLDAIRKADVVSGEAGGITQHIGAYQVKTEDGHLVTFIDTPGHEAFTAMRARGAQVTDIAVIVVAADDGVMPQTVEAINHAKAAEVPMIVAINKVDKPSANIERIKQQLTEYEIVPEEWGGTTIFCPVSALKKTGIKELLEQIYLVAEVEELRANPKRSATGVVIESRMDKGRGAVATLLVQDGTLKVGQPFVVGQIAGRVRSLINDRGERVQEAGPSVPVQVLGLPEAPQAGDHFDSCESEKAAEDIARLRREQVEQASAGTPKMSLEALFSKMQQGDMKELPIILKTDVAGSAEAIKGMFEKLGTQEVKIKVIHTAVGGINESDVLLASTAKGIVVGFNVRPDGGALNAAKREGVEIKTYSIVYELMDDMKKAMSGLLTPEVIEKVLGRAEVRNTFSVPKIGTIAGCAVVDGKITRQSQLRLIRDGIVVYTGKVSSLKRFKDDAKEVVSGYECGIGIENFNDIKVGDVMEAFMQETLVREI